MTHVDAFRISVSPLFHLSRFTRLRSLAPPAGQGLLLAALLLFLAGTAQAAGSSMPWEGPLQSILESIQGPVARIVAVIIIIATGLALAFGDTSGGFRKLIQIVFGLSIAFAASSFFLSFFSFSGGAVV
ncbi:TrbC/VirB2 family protein [[Acidovorax] ebreus]|uniref:Conjugal transfer protein TrbC n=1 Tax=Acidovorax ebreus (strain TPSY) TaxID=535289 RepID=A0A9J9QAW3_ACIET|nr:TrbC/VirB2 family protein [[Acidovorax] ebreus]ACM32782.1 Conjugal transfer protein TrbC [[Acidovorax] ebreus TPSY]